MQCYLFVHFKEKTTPAGEQVYFALSKDGFNWEEVNGGSPVLWSYYGDKGVRDHTIVKSDFNGKYYIFSTDLSLAYGMRNQYESSWKNIAVNGSKFLSMWESEDLVHWNEEKLVKIGTDDLGCVWAPDIILDKTAGEYILHWSSPHKSDGFTKKKIYYSKTKDFENFSQPQVLYEKEDSGVIDSAMYEENGMYYLFVKSEHNPSKMILLKSTKVQGPFERVPAFDTAMQDVEEGLYEAPTAVRTEKGEWLLFIDYYGAKGAGQGYVPFVAQSLEKADFKRSDTSFNFPYGFKHGTILPLTEEEYTRIKSFNFDLDDYSKY